MRNLSSKIVAFFNKLIAFITTNTAYFFIILFIIMILVLKSYNSNILILSRAAVINYTLPIFEHISKVSSFILFFPSNVKSFFMTYSENRDLKEKVEMLNMYIYQNEVLRDENQSLKEIISFSSESKNDGIFTRILGNNQLNANYTMLIGAGSRDFVEEGQIVINSEGLVGRVVNVFPQSSIILQITDYQSHIPVILLTSKERAILKGGSKDCLKLNYLQDENNVIEGELVVTSGDGDKIRYGTPVGKIVRKDENICVEPFFNRKKFEYVKIIDNE